MPTFARCADLEDGFAGLLPDTGRRFSCPSLIVSEELLAALKRKYPLILVSNTNEAHIDFVRANYRVLDYFDHLVFSYEVGSLKPDREIFDRAIQRRRPPRRSIVFHRRSGRKHSPPPANSAYTRTKFNSETKLLDALQRAGVEIADFVGS